MQSPGVRIQENVRVRMQRPATGSGGWSTYVKKPEWTAWKRGNDCHSALKTHSFEVKMAFSMEEAPCGSTGFFTIDRCVLNPET